MSRLFRSFAGAPTLAALAELHAAYVGPALRLLGRPAGPPPPCRPLLLLAGGAGAGKASLANYLCGQPVFPVRNKLAGDGLRVATPDARPRSLLPDQAAAYLRERDPALAALLAEVPPALAGDAAVHLFAAHGGEGFGLEGGPAGARAGSRGPGAFRSGTLGPGGEPGSGELDHGELGRSGLGRGGELFATVRGAGEGVGAEEAERGGEGEGEGRDRDEAMLWASGVRARPGEPGEPGAPGAPAASGFAPAASGFAASGFAASAVPASAVAPPAPARAHASRAFPFTIVKLPDPATLDKALRKPALEFARKAASRAAAVYVCLDAESGALPRSFLQLLECFLSDPAVFARTSFLLTRCDRLETTADVLASVAHYSSNLTRAFPYREFRFQMVCLPRFAAERARITSRRRQLLARRAEEQARCLEATGRDLGRILSEAREVADMLDLLGSEGAEAASGAGAGPGAGAASPARTRAPWFAQASAFWEGSASSPFGRPFGEPAGSLESGAVLPPAADPAPEPPEPRAVTIVDPAPRRPGTPSGRRSRSPNLEVRRPPSPPGSRRSPVVLHRTPSTSPGRLPRAASAGALARRTPGSPAPGSLAPAAPAPFLSAAPRGPRDAGLSARARSISLKLQALQADILGVSTAVTRSLAATEVFEPGSGVELPPLSAASRRARSEARSEFRSEALTASALAGPSAFLASCADRTAVGEEDTMGLLLSQADDLVSSLYGLLDGEAERARARVLEDIAAVEAELRRQRAIQQTVHRHNAWMRALRAGLLLLILLWGAVLCLHTADSGERAFGRCLVEAREGYAGAAHPRLRGRVCAFFYFSLTRGFDRFFRRPLFALFGWLALGLFVALFVVTGVYYMQYPVPREAYNAASITYQDILAREAERLRAAEE